MKRVILALAAAGASFVALAGPPSPAVTIANIPLPVDDVTVRVDPLDQIVMRRHICSATAAQCERTLPLTSPVDIYEVFFALGPSDPIPPDNAQCAARVSLSEDGVTFYEIAKFAVPASDLHGVTHVLPRPIGLRANDGTTVLQILAYAFGPNPLAPCEMEVKLYMRAD